MSDQSTSNKPFKGRIEDWDTIRFDPALAFDNLGFVITGRPLGHLEFTGWIRTSAVVKVNDKQIPWTVETLNSIYELGDPANRYMHYYGVNKPID
jgi:hypothetical protein